MAFKTVNSKQRMYALGRMKAGKMNKTEAAFELWIKSQPDVVWYKFEGMKFKLAEKCFYTPDFMVLHDSGSLVAYEVKGFWQDDARVKIKTAAEMFPIHFVAVKKDRNGWKFENF